LHDSEQEDSQKQPPIPSLLNREATSDRHAENQVHFRAR
jgi:hypothetical protein